MAYTFTFPSISCIQFFIVRRSTLILKSSQSSFFGGHLANTLGRLRGIAIGAAIFGLGAAVEAGSVNLGMLLAGRAVKGVGEGLFLSTSVV